jgi:hypothetical protein
MPLHYIDIIFFIRFHYFAIISPTLLSVDILADWMPPPTPITPIDASLSLRR